MTTPARIIADGAVRAYELAQDNLDTALGTERTWYTNWKRLAMELGSNAPATVQARTSWEQAGELRSECARRLHNAAEDLSVALRGVELEGPT